MSNSRRSPSLIPFLWASTTLAVESPVDLFVASHWLERSCRFPVALHVLRRADHSTSQVLTTFYVVFNISTFYWRLASKASKLIRPHADWSTAVMSHAAVNSDARSIQISSQNIPTLSKQAISCSAIRPNYQSQPPLMGFTYIGPSYAGRTIMHIGWKCSKNHSLTKHKKNCTLMLNSHSRTVWVSRLQTVKTFWVLLQHKLDTFIRQREEAEQIDRQTENIPSMHYTVCSIQLQYVDLNRNCAISISNTHVVLILSLSLRFNGHFPGEHGLAGTRMSTFWILL